MSVSGGTPLGTKVKPNERTSSCEGLRVLDDRFVVFVFI